MRKIFYNGTIITMEAELYVQAVLVEQGYVVKTGNFEELQSGAPDAVLIDLLHKTMLPAFIDAHSHFTAYANAQLQIPLDETVSFEEIEERIAAFIASKNIPAGKWIAAKGYDHNMLVEKCHPKKELLDRLAEDNPLVLQHQSGHCGVFNSKALELLDITPDTKAPAGGMIGSEGGVLTGYMEEEAYIQCIKKVPISDDKEMLVAYGKAQEKYLSYGITTVQEGMMVSQMLPLYQPLLESGILTVDVVGFSDLTSMRDIANAFPGSYKKYDRHFKIGGYKIFLDGSPQVKTAWMQSPYKGSDDNYGYGTMSDVSVIAAVEKSMSEDIQILAHCNGDAAIQQYIDAVKKAAHKNKNILNLKPVIIHSQLITKEQLAEVSRLNMIPSFFLAHVLHWGDIHIQNFGYERAQYISPANSALQNGIIFTFHQDTPVIEPNMLETIQCAVTRRTKKGIALGADECISVIEALRAVTINAAYQYSEEDVKGSIREGKRADFVIMSGNPITVPKDKITDIIILETIKDGETVYRLS